MRLLILTQTVDRKDSTLGFFHRWIEGLAKRVEHVTVFALNIGTNALPENVSVVPLRPWGYRARLRTALRAFTLSWKYRRDYDTVFVHMNEEYLLVAGLLWKCLGKRVYFWRNHYEGSILTDIAALFADTVFYTSRSSYTAKYRKAKQMPVGVDVDSCHLDERIDRKPHSVLFLARFDRSKRPELLVDALGQLKKEGIEFSATFVGGPKDGDPEYPNEVKKRAVDLGINDCVSFVGAVANTETYRYYRSHDVFVNCSRSGMLDKTMFKANACGAITLSSSADMKELAGPEYVYADEDVADLARLLQKTLALPEAERARQVKELQKNVVEAHSLDVLMDALAVEFSTH